MATSMNVQAAFKLDRQFWKTVAVEVIRKIRVRTQQGRDYDNKRFPAYDADYAKLKKRGFTRLTNRTGARGTKYQQYSGVSLERQTNPPNFQLTRKTMGDLSLLLLSDQFVDIGWRGEPGGVVDSHEERGKYKVGGISSKEFDQTLDMIGKQFDKQWNKKVKNVTVNVGRR